MDIYLIFHEGILVQATLNESIAARYRSWGYMIVRTQGHSV